MNPRKMSLHALFAAALAGANRLPTLDELSSFPKFFGKRHERSKYKPHDGNRKAARERFNAEIASWLRAQRRLARQFVSSGVSYDTAIQMVLDENTAKGITS